jgi:hypothetical protein
MESGGTRGSGPAASGAEVGNQGDLENIFDKSLDDFDGQMQRENAGMASTGAGSGRSAQQREASDAGAVRDSARNQSGGSMASTSGMSGMSGSSGSDSEMGQADPGAQSAEEAGSGQNEVQSGLGGGDTEESQRDGGQVAKIPEDIPADGSAEDQVARQIREAAMAETDPDIRDALWDEYRKHTGIKK